MMYKNKHLALLFLLFVFKICGIDQSRLVVVVPSYNNAQWCQRNLSSILSQKYDNFVGVYVDDLSTDATKQLVTEFLVQNDFEKKITLKANVSHYFKAKNLWLVLHELYENPVKINDNDIVVICDGDDWYATDYVFSFLNAVYRLEGIWMTYGGYQTFANNSLSSGDASLSIQEDIKKNNLYRESYGYLAQIRSFYAWLYRQIKLEDFFYQGKFIPMASDAAKIFPMLEMSAGRFKRIMQPLYVYNRSNAINDDKVNNVLQHDIDHSLRERVRYTPLKDPVVDAQPPKTIDVLILTDDQKCMASCKDILSEYFTGVGTIYSSEHFSKDELVKKLAGASGEFVLCMVEIAKPLRKVDLEKVAFFMHETHAFSFNPILSKGDVPAINEKLAFSVSAWQNVVADELIKKYAFKTQVYHKHDLLNFVQNSKISSFSEMLATWKKSDLVNDQYKINLFFDVD